MFLSILEKNCVCKHLIGIAYNIGLLSFPTLDLRIEKMDPDFLKPELIHALYMPYTLTCQPFTRNANQIRTFIDFNFSDFDLKNNPDLSYSGSNKKVTHKKTGSKTVRAVRPPPAVRPSYRRSLSITLLCVLAKPGVCSVFKKTSGGVTKNTEKKPVYASTCASMKNAGRAKAPSAKIRYFHKTGSCFHEVLANGVFADIVRNFLASNASLKLTSQVEFERYGQIELIVSRWLPYWLGPRKVVTLFRDLPRSVGMLMNHVFDQ
ncbi:hypothetical protein BpHYR1_001044 [Brachionus plicatilis]|uniref:Uncharacterized protein n=1 Tax=Brachionus plicatilis TaxID=10195 RepID=A0A3M7QD03_BRAPC|nr:hypothetical protein BpHYR1_001044 [Brachionus plicatilis]